MYTHRGAYLNALAELAHAKLDCRSVYLWTLPMFHCNGWCFPWAATAAGGRHVCLRKVDQPLVWRLFEEEGITHLNGAPTVLVMLGSDPAAKPLPHPILVTTAGAPPPPAVIERTEALGFSDQSRLRADGDVRPDHDLRVASGLGRPRRRRARAAEGPPGPEHGHHRPHPRRRR